MGMCIDEIDGAPDYSVEVRSSHGEFVVHGTDPHDYVYNGAARPEHVIGVTEQRRPSQVVGTRMSDDDFETQFFVFDQYLQGLGGAQSSVFRRAAYRLLDELARARAAEVEHRDTGVGTVTFNLADISQLRAVLDRVEEYVATQK